MMSFSDSIYIFLGPSLSISRARKILPAHYLPPIKRGNLAKVVEKGAKTIAIIDGCFYRAYSPSPFEILSALQRKVKIYGSSSMGALKAVECESFGMVGVGEIFKWYRSGKIDAEDEVAIVFDPATLKSLSNPLVSMRWAFALAQKEGILSSAEKNSLLRWAKKIYFPERSYKHLFSLSKTKGLPLSKIKRLSRFVKKEICDLKALDAIECLKRIREDLKKE